MPIDYWSKEVLLASLCENPLFENIPVQDIERLVPANSASHLHLLPAHLKFWEHPGELDFSIVLSGCVLVIDRHDDHETSVDAILAPKQLLGEFELLGFNSNGLRLEAVNTDTVLFSPGMDRLQTLINDHPETFYRNLGRTLVNKLKVQNEWIRLHDKRSVTRRLANLLKQFHSNPAWSGLVFPRKEGPGMDIDVIWTFAKLEYCLSSTMRSIGKAFQSLIREGIIEVRHLPSLRGSGTVVDQSFFRKAENKAPATYVKISLLDGDTLLRGDYTLDEDEGSRRNRRRIRTK